MKSIISLALLVFLLSEVTQGMIPPPVLCFYDNNYYPVGKTFNPDDCTSCRCDVNGQALCAIMDCAAPQCPQPIKIKGQCCPVCRGGYLSVASGLLPFEPRAVQSK